MRKLFDTSKMPYEVWQEKRNIGYGGSEVGAILGLNPYCSPIEVWARKTDPLYEFEDKENMYWGRKLEPVIGEEFQIRAEARGDDFKVERFEYIIGHDDYDIVTGNIDFLITSEKEGNGVLECKNVSDQVFQKWNKGDIPEYYIVQVQWYMGIMKLSYGYFAALIGGRTWKGFRLEADPRLFQLMVNEVIAFDENHVQTNIPPDLIGVPSEVTFLYGIVERYANFDDPEVADEVEEHCIQYMEMNALKKFFDGRLEVEKNTIKIAVGKDGKAVANEWKISNGKRFTITPPKHYKGKKWSHVEAENYVIRNLINTRKVVEYE